MSGSARTAIISAGTASQATSRPPAGAAEDWTVAQRWRDYTASEHATWDLLYERQVRQLPDLVVPAFMQGLESLRLAGRGIPDFVSLSERLQKLTGWSVVCVPGLVPDEIFFRHLANRRFVAGRFVRSADQLDYLQEPDVFHDVFGHVPLLANAAYADYMQAYGRGGLRAIGFNQIARLAHLYWYTVEFGLIRDQDQLRLFGAGIVSSHAESRYALYDPIPLRIRFNLKRVLQTEYRIDAFQQNYFVIDSFEDLLRQTVEVDFADLYRELATMSDLPVAQRLPGDEMLPPNRNP
jgi:phenylalanine-4-hydroxylase